MQSDEKTAETWRGATIHELEKWRSEIDAELQKRARIRRTVSAPKSQDCPDFRVSEGVYRNPDCQFETWAGKGRRPAWIGKWLAEGGSLSDLRIDELEPDRGITGAGRDSADKPEGASEGAEK